MLFLLKKYIQNTTIFRAGFTLIELIVTVGIFALVSTVVLVRNSQFDNEVLLSGVAYDVALSIRQAQNYGINVLGQGNNFDHPYGVYFASNTGEDVTTYVLFRDLNGNYAYDPNMGEFEPGEVLETFTLGRGFTVGRICNLAKDPPCESPLVDGATILFLRPNPDAIINAGADGVPTITSVGIELITPRGGSRLIIVESTGQISISRFDEEATVGDPVGTVGI